MRIQSITRQAWQCLPREKSRLDLYSASRFAVRLDCGLDYYGKSNGLELMRSIGLKV
jgi:hypothetical protein